MKDKDLEIFKILVDDNILPWVADGVPMSYALPPVIVILLLFNI